MVKGGTVESAALVSRPGCLEPRGATRHALRRHSSRAGALPRGHFDHAAVPLGTCVEEAAASYLDRVKVRVRVRVRVMVRVRVSVRVRGGGGVILGMQAAGEVSEGAVLGGHPPG